MHVKVSILVPVYRVENYIEKCAHSLFAQTFNEIEFIFVDDCTPDNSIGVLQEVIQQYPNRQEQVRIIRHRTNNGVAQARNTALREASGDYILMLDSDDYIERDMVQLMYEKAQSEQADMVLCGVVYEFADGTSVNQYPFSKVSDKIECLQTVFEGSSALWHKMLRRSIITNHAIDFHSGINYGEDLLFLARFIYYVERFAIVDKALYHYVQYNPYAITRIFTPAQVQQTLQVVQQLNDFFSDKPLAYAQLMLRLKAVRKAKILRSGFLLPEYIALYPELDVRRLASMSLDGKTKLLLLLAATKCYVLLRLMVKMLLKRKIGETHRRHEVG